MPRKNRLKTLLLLPIAAIIFTVGWIVANAPQRKQPLNKQKKAEQPKNQDIQFLVGIEETQVIPGQ